MKPHASLTILVLVLSSSIQAQDKLGGPGAKQSQFPSPMVETTREHPRLKEEKPAGRREKLSIGMLFIPQKLTAKDSMPLFIHFHGGTWIPDVAAARDAKAAVISVQLGSGSAVYAKPFADPKRFAMLIDEAETNAKVKFGPIGLTAWSAGYGAIREILKVPANFERINFVLLLDALHTGYEGGKPGPVESKLQTANLDIFLQFARAAVAGKKQMLVTHTEIFPGTFASTTETADYLLKELKLRRKATLEWGPMNTQQLSEVKEGKFRLLGYAGNSAPDHVDQLHALPDYLTWVEWK